MPGQDLLNVPLQKLRNIKVPSHIKPSHLLIFFKPGHLALGVLAGILFDQLYGLLACSFTVYRIKYLLIAHGL